MTKSIRTKERRAFLEAEIVERTEAALPTQEELARRDLACKRLAELRAQARLLVHFPVLKKCFVKIASVDCRSGAGNRVVKPGFPARIMS